MLRLAHRLGVAVPPPPAYPFNPLLVLRVASLPLEAAARRRLIDALFVASWGGGGGVTPEAVARAALVAGLDEAALVREAATPAAKERVRQQTDAALGQGVFGVPSVAFNGEMLWGCDAFPDVDDFLRGQDPVWPELLLA